MAFLIGPFFALLYSALTAYFSFVFIRSQRRSSNRITFYFTGLGICCSVIFLLQGIGILVFSSGSWGLTIFTNLIYFFLAYLGVAIFAMTTSFTLAPRIKPLYFFIASASIGVAALYINISTLSMTTVNTYGIVDRHIPGFMFFLQNIMVLFSFLPSCIGLVSHSLKSRFPAKGVIFTIGGFMFAIFLTMSNQTQDFYTFIFLNILCIVGWGLMLASFTIWRDNKIN